MVTGVTGGVIVPFTIGSLRPLPTYEVTSHPGFLGIVLVLALKICVPRNPLLPGKPEWLVILSHLRSLSLHMQKYHLKAWAGFLLKLHGKNTKYTLQPTLPPFFYLKSQFSFLSSQVGRKVICPEATLYGGGREVSLKLKGRSALKQIVMGTLGSQWRQLNVCRLAANAQLMPESMSWKTISSARFCHPSDCRETKRWIIISSMECLEGLQGNVLSALKLVPREQLLLNQGQEGHELGNHGVTCEINSLLIVVSCAGVYSSLPVDHKCQEPYTHPYARVGPISSKCLIFTS